MALHAQRQGFDPSQDHESVERRHRRAQIAQAKHAAGDGEGEIAEGLVQNHALIGRAWLGQKGNLSLADQSKDAAINDNAADGVAVAAENLVS
jgi:signal transduction histidine kinase